MSDLVWTNITVRLGDLRPWADNPRMSTKAQAKRLLVSFDKFGQVQTVAVDSELSVLDGHQRLSALLTIHGPDYVLDARQSNRPLTDAERRELVISLHAGAVGSWDWDKVSSWQADELKGWGMDGDLLKSWNNDANNLKELLRSEKPSADADVDTDRAAELLEKWQVQTGDLWQIGEHRLICGDCTDAATVARVMDGQRADLGFADPPYNAGVDEWDKGFAWSHDWLIDLCTYVIVTPGISAAHNFMKATNMPYKWTLAAYISNGFSRSAVGFGWWMYAPLFSNDSVFKQKPDAIEIALIVGQADTPARHRGQKPPQFMEWVVGLYGDNVVFDCFCGSGTTLVACENLGRKCRAIEISPAYVAVALERMSAAFPSLEIRRME
jgi:hypothetical protein